jgi:hypothetical protein
LENVNLQIFLKKTTEAINMEKKEPATQARIMDSRGFGGESSASTEHIAHRSKKKN